MKMFVRSKWLKNSLVLLSSLFCLVIVNQAFGIDNPPPAKHLLWKISSKSNTVFILGSIHLLNKEAYPLNDVFEKTFSKTKKLVLEADPEEMRRPDFQKLTLDKALLPKGKTLQGSIAPATYELVKATADNLGMGIESFSRFKPWFVAITLTTAQLQKLGFNPEYGVDVYFYHKAQKTGKKVIGLESARFQIDLFADMPLVTQEKLLRQALEDMNVMEQDFNRLIDAWKIGDTTALEKILLDSFKGHPVIFKRIISNRNKAWAKRIKMFLKQEEPFFIVVGAGHLLGREGLINLFKKQGDSVEQL